MVIYIIAGSILLLLLVGMLLICKLCKDIADSIHKVLKENNDNN